MEGILIIEDDEFVRKMLQHFLERKGHMVATATNGRDGIEAYQLGSFDLVITDLIMP